MPSEPTFKTNRDYLNVYFMAVDAAGHSSIVRQNDANAADYAFDKFEELVYQAVDDAVAAHRCGYAEFWGWRGDGGLCVFYDEEESFARRAALAAASYVLEELEILNTRVRRHGLKGELHIRIALHKGHFRYKGDAKRGSIHSSQLNFCAHLEEVTPKDTIAISEDIYELLDEEQRLYVPAALPFEGRHVFLKSGRSHDEIAQEWVEKVAPGDGSAIVLKSDVQPAHLGIVGCYANRTITRGYSDLMGDARELIWASAIAFGGFQNDHRRMMVRKATEGIDIRLLALEPDVARVAVKSNTEVLSLPAWYDRLSGQGDYCQRAIESLPKWISDINDEVHRMTGDASRAIKLRYSGVFPSGATLAIDRTMFFSPYLAHAHNLKMPSFEFSQDGVLFEKFYRSFVQIWSSDSLSRAET